MTEKKESKASSSPYEVPGHPVERGTTDFYIKFFSHFIFIFIFLVMVPTILIGICLSFWVSPLVLGATGYIFYRMIKKRLNVLNNMSDEEYDACFTKEFVPPIQFSVEKPVKRGTKDFYIMFYIHFIPIFLLTIIGPTIFISICFSFWIAPLMLCLSSYVFYRIVRKYLNTLNNMSNDEYEKCFGYVHEHDFLAEAQERFIEDQRRCPLGSLSLEHVTNTASASYNLYGPGSNNPY